MPRRRSGSSHALNATNARAWAPLAALGLAVAVAIFVDGGFGQTARAAFAACAGMALITAGVTSGRSRSLLEFMRSPAIAALAVLACLTALSAVWTVGEPARALRWALVLGGYCALAIAAAVFSNADRGRERLATLIAVSAVASAAVGLWAFAVRTEPLALHLGGEWRPAGPFEYPPALAGAQLAAMPIMLLAAVRAERPWVRGVAASGLALATLVVALSSSRVVIALGAMLIAASILWPWRPEGASPGLVAKAWSITAGVPVLLVIALDPADPASALSSDGARLAMVGATAIAVGVGWRTWRAISGPVAARPRPLPGPAVALLVAVCCGAAGLGAAVASERGGPGVEAESGFAHGRVEHWDAAGEVINRNQILGSGGESFFRASRRFQGGDPVLYAHSLPLEVTAELGIAGAVTAAVLYAGVGIALWRRRWALELWLFGSGAATFLVLNLVDWTWHLAGAGAIWALALGGLVGTDVPARRPARTRGRASWR